MNYFKFCGNCKTWNNYMSYQCAKCGGDISNNPVYQYELGSEKEPVLYNPNNPEHWAEYCRYVQMANQQPYFQPCGNEKKKHFTAGCIIGVISSVALLISPFLPFVQVEYFAVKESLSIRDICGFSDILFWLALLLFGCTIEKWKKLTVAVGTFNFVLVLGITITVESRVQEKLSDYQYLVHYGMGFFLAIASSIAIIVSGIVMLGEDD